jgi:nicotinamide riboside kinase
MVFMGAESTGKSTLAERMAQELEMPLVKEFSREHYQAKGGVLHDLDSRGIAYYVVRGSLEERVEQVKRVLRG